MIDNSGARRSNNKRNALVLAKLGVAVFPSSGKVPLIPRFNKLDTALSAAERDAAIEEYKEKNDGKEPIHVGATKDPEVIKRMWRAHRDAVPSISCGPSKLVVIDADAKDNGHELMDALFKENGGVPKGAPVIPTKSGGRHYVFADPDSAFTNKAGLLKKSYGSDVRGSGGQFVAPGSIRDDGKTYGTETDFKNFCRAISAKAIPTLPAFISDLIGRGGDHTSEAEQVTPSEEGKIIAHLRNVDWPEFADVFDSTLGKYDLDAILAGNAELKAIWESEPTDCSTARFKLARGVMRECPDLQPEELAVLFEHCPAAGTITDDKPSTGEYDHRQIAREWKKNTGLSKPSTGEAFGVVSDDDPDDRTAFIANGGSVERWNQLQEKWAEARAARQAQTSESKPGQDGKTLPFEMESDVAASATLPDWLVDEVVEAETLCVLYGAPNVGKSLALLDMLYHVAAGKPWHGRETKKGCVLYVSVEGPNGTARRAKAWRSHHGIADGENLPLAFVRVDVDLFNDKKAANAIVEAVALLEAMTGLPCRAVALDTVNAVTPGMDENSSADVGAFLRNLRTILAKTSAAVLPVHHTGKDASKGMRGSNALLAKAETTLLVTEGLITTMKMRDGARGQKFPFAIKILNLWEKDGKPVGAPVAVEVERGAAMGAVIDEDEEVPLCKRSDTRDDRVSVFVEVAKELAGREAANAEPLHEVRLSLPTIEKAFNARRNGFCALDGKPLKPLNREGVARIASAAIDAGLMRKKGAEYFLKCEETISGDSD